MIVANGNLAKELLSSLEQILGRQDGIEAVTITDNCNRQTMEQEIAGVARRVDEGDGVIVAADIFGSSAMNMARPVTCDGGCEIVTGVNLPLLIALARARRKPLDEAAEIAVHAGRKYILRTRGGD